VITNAGMSNEKYGGPVALKEPYRRKSKVFAPMNYLGAGYTVSKS